jgi:hypothetical protein
MLKGFLYASPLSVSPLRTGSLRTGRPGMNN